MPEFKLDVDQLAQLEKKIGKLKEVGENIINESLRNFGVRTTIKDISQLIPKSSRAIKNPKKGTTKHAKGNNPLKNSTFNLGFYVNSKSEFNYLVFPNEGIGKRNKTEQRFIERGLEEATPKIIDELNNVLNKRIEEEL